MGSKKLFSLRSGQSITIISGMKHDENAPADIEDIWQGVSESSATLLNIHLQTWMHTVIAGLPRDHKSTHA